jgi:plasmid stability protein
MMGHKIAVRLDEKTAAWLKETAARSGVSQGKLVRDQLEKARASEKGKGFMRLAGTIDGPQDLSSRQGFSRAGTR